MRAAPPPKAIALSGNPAMIAADPSDPINPACFKNSRRCVKLVLISPPHSVCMHEQSGNSAIRFGRQGAPESPWQRIPQFGLRRHCLHQSTLIITALACKREYGLGIAARLD